MPRENTVFEIPYLWYLGALLTCWRAEMVRDGGGMEEGWRIASWRSAARAEWNKWSIKMEVGRSLRILPPPPQDIGVDWQEM